MGSSERRRLIGFGRSEGRMTMSDATLSAEEAAKFLGLATSTLAKLRLSGHGPVYCKLGRRVVYRREDLEAWLESRAVRNTSDADARLPKSLTGKRPEITDGRTKAHATPRKTGLGKRAHARPILTPSAKVRPANARQDADPDNPG
jgi:excisionase family DNA binding protein